MVVAEVRPEVAQLGSPATLRSPFPGREDWLKIGCVCVGRPCCRGHARVRKAPPGGANLLGESLFAGCPFQVPIWVTGGVKDEGHFIAMLNTQILGRHVVLLDVVV